MKRNKKQSGQTLVEVIVAIFILTMALVSGVGLAIYSNSRNLNNRNLIIATNLAREGIETARILRDSNWLAAEDETPTGQNANVDDLYTQNGGCTYSNGNRPCYPEAFTLPADLTARNDWRVLFDINTQDVTLDWRNGSENMLLCLTNGIYMHSASCTLSNFQFARQIVITNNTVAPYTTSSGTPNNTTGHSPEKIVTAIVVWNGKGCALITDGNDIRNVAGPCKIQMTERITNWKDYR
ncbi:MAG: type II secretion system GspH family protein [Candidatus Doudnabacteria bacterium]|nr:type II secretion system GspH family protein [Candidatus Doudnabacteria bacterium]